MPLTFASRSTKELSVCCLPFTKTILLWILIYPSTSKGLLQDKYFGCFQDTSLTTVECLLSSTALTVDRCVAECLGRQTTYAALQNGNCCRCRNDYGLQLSDKTCDLTCSGNKYESCRGVIGQLNAYVVYAVCPAGTYGGTCDQGCHCKRDVPCDRTTGKCPDGCHGEWSGSACNIMKISRQYIGCYGDVRSLRAMEECVFCDVKGYSDHITTGYCFQLCSARNYSYAGTQWSKECFCGESYTRHGPLNEASCNMTCSGDRREICGGPDALSVYSVCPIGYYGKSCAARCHCLNNNRCIYRNGYCPSSRCKPGWTGTSCSIRDCKQNNGDCFTNESCSNIDLKYSKISLCRCSDGYFRNNTWENCTDIDECVNTVCDPESAMCKNTVGSYNCMCRGGFKRLSETTCIDKDECVSTVCDPESEMCNNTVGSYSCMCRSGFKRLNDTTCIGEGVDFRTIVTAVGFIIGVVVAVVIAVTILLVYRNRQRKSTQNNELQSTASVNNRKPYSSQGKESECRIGSVSISNVEDSAQYQSSDTGDVYTSLKAVKYRPDESRIYAHLSNAKASKQNKSTDKSSEYVNFKADEL